MIKVKEMKDDALIDVKVNKSFYLMSKKVLFYLYTQLEGKEEARETLLKKIHEEKYEELDDLQQSFYTISLLLAEMESQATQNDLYKEVEMLEPEDEGYVPQTTS